MPFPRKRRRLWIRLCLTVLLLGALLVGINVWVSARGNARIATTEEVRPATTALVLGALVFPDGRPSDMLKDRLETGLRLYQAGKVEKILVSGDHGQAAYDEVNAMRLWLEAKGVPTEDIFMDHAGFDTYNSLYRARDVFDVRQVILITQRFHLPRALYIAGALGLDAQGVAADLHIYPRLAYYQFREAGARLKAFGEVVGGARPVFLGPTISITGDGRLTHDRPR